MCSDNQGSWIWGALGVWESTVPTVARVVVPSTNEGVWHANLYREPKWHLNNASATITRVQKSLRIKDALGPGHVILCREWSSLSQRVLCQRFHCTCTVEPLNKGPTIHSMFYLLFPLLSQSQAGVSDEAIEEALAQLRSMGYQDEGGWLKELVRAKGGDVAKVLDALHPSVDQDWEQEQTFKKQTLTNSHH